MTHTEKVKPLSPATASPRSGAHGWGDGWGAGEQSPPSSEAITGNTTTPFMLQAGMGVCPFCTSLSCTSPPSSGAISLSGATPLSEANNKEWYKTTVHFFIWVSG